MRLSSLKLKETNFYTRVNLNNTFQSDLDLNSSMACFSLQSRPKRLLSTEISRKKIKKKKKPLTFIALML